MLRAFCGARMGWGSERVDELLLPALRAFEERQAQQTLDAYLTARERAAKIKSKRLLKVGGAGGGGLEGSLWGLGLS